MSKLDELGKEWESIRADSTYSMGCDCSTDVEKSKRLARKYYESGRVEEREAVARTIGLSASTAGLSPKDLAKDDDWKEAVEKIKRSEREAIKKELDLKNQKPEDYSYANGNDMESFCRGYNACKEYVEWVIDGKPDLLNELNKN